VLPVCSAVLKQDTGGLVVKWVTIGEYLLLYVFDFFFFVAQIDIEQETSAAAGVVEDVATVHRRLRER
jgi:hypothetical protein